MKELIRKLTLNLGEQLKGYSELAEILRKENSLNPGFNPDHLTTIEQIQKDKESLVESLRLLEVSREETVKSVLTLLPDPGISEETPLRIIAEHFTPEEKKQILDLREQLLKVINTVKELAEKNSQVSKVRGSTFRQTLEKLTGSGGVSKTYAGSGKIRKGKSSGIFTKLV